ncbi:hypothetical protein PMAYCL1PPCAC_16990, partial [Pristionchus mayeri]
FEWVHQNPFHVIFLSTSTTISVLSNGLLLFIIATTPSSTIGNYRYLLASFATCDIMTNLAHAGLQPLLHQTDSGLYFFSSNVGIVIGGQSYDTVFCLIFITSFYQTFLVLAYHYVYRLVTLTSGLSRSITRYWTPKHWISLGIFVNILYVAGFMAVCLFAFTPSDETRALVPPEIRQLYGVDLQSSTSGFAVISRPDPITGQQIVHASSVIALCCLVSMFGGTAIVIIYCILRINAVIRSTDSDMTGKTRKMQMDLFHALLIQSAVPVFCSYIPLATILLFGPITGDISGSFGNVFFSATAVFPSIDAFFVLFFIGRFRSAVIRLFRLPFHDHHGSSIEHRTVERRTHETSSRF